MKWMRLMKKAMANGSDWRNNFVQFSTYITFHLIIRLIIHWAGLDEIFVVSEDYAVAGELRQHMMSQQHYYSQPHLSSRSCIKSPSPLDTTHKPPMLFTRPCTVARATFPSFLSRTTRPTPLENTCALRCPPVFTPVRHATHGAQGRANGPKNGPGKRLGAKKTGGKTAVAPTPRHHSPNQHASANITKN